MLFFASFCRFENISVVFFSNKILLGAVVKNWLNAFLFKIADMQASEAAHYLTVIS